MNNCKAKLIISSIIWIIILFVVYLIIRSMHGVSITTIVAIIGLLMLKKIIRFILDMIYFVVCLSIFILIIYMMVF